MSFSVRLNFSELGLVIACVVCAVLALALRARSARSSRAPVDRSDRKTSTTTGSKQEREPGEWTPVDFDYPPVEPFTDDISTVKPIPYRPFRWGTYHVTMGIRNMAWDEWIELDQQFFDYHKIVQHRLETRGERAVQVLPAKPGVVAGGHAAAEEFVHELAEYLSRRYPAIYAVVRKVKSEKGISGWYGEGQIKTITVIPLQVTYDLDKEEPLKVASLLVQEDFAIMIEGTDGRYYLQAGAICIPGFWRLSDKIGMPLDEIHTTGKVPQFESKLDLSMGRFFRRLPVDKPVVRNNYGFQVVKPPAADAAQHDPAVRIDPTELAWSRSMHGNEDKSDFERSAVIRGSQAPTNEMRDPSAPLDPATVYLRTERQTLRRLPRSGGIIFTIRVYQTPVVELAEEPGVPGRLASGVRGWSDDVAEYKDLFAYKDILSYLDERHADQVEKGVVAADDRTAVYPL